MTDDSTVAFAVAKYVREEMVSRTFNGVILLTLGVLLSAVPIVRPIASLVAFAGIVLYINGRDAFGEKHSIAALIGGAVFLLGLVFVLVGSISYLVFVLSNNSSDPNRGNQLLLAALAPSLPSILQIDTIGSIISGVAFAILPMRLHKGVGRVMLIFGLVTSVAASLTVLSILSSDASPVVLRYAGGYGGYESTAADMFETQVLVTSLLNLLPATIFAISYASLYSRLKREDLTVH